MELLLEFTLAVCLDLWLTDFLFLFFFFWVWCCFKLFFQIFFLPSYVNFNPHTISGCPAFRTLSSSCSFGEFTSAFPLQAVHSKFHAVENSACFILCHCSIALPFLLLHMFQLVAYAFRKLCFCFRKFCSMSGIINQLL